MIWNRWGILNPNLQYFFASERDWRYSRPLPMFAFDDWMRGLLGNHAHWVEGRVEGPILSTLYHLHAEDEKETESFTKKYFPQLLFLK